MRCTHKCGFIARPFECWLIAQAPLFDRIHNASLWRLIGNCLFVAKGETHRFWLAAKMRLVLALIQCSIDTSTNFRNRRKLAKFSIFAPFFVLHYPSTTTTKITNIMMSSSSSGIEIAACWSPQFRVFSMSINNSESSLAWSNIFCSHFRTVQKGWIICAGCAPTHPAPQ